MKREIRLYAPLVPLRIYTRIHTINKLVKPILVFRLKGFKNHRPLGRHIPTSLSYRGRTLLILSITGVAIHAIATYKEFLIFKAFQNLFY